MSGPFGSTLKGDAYLSSGDIAFIRVQNIKGGFDINDNDLVYISNKDNEKIKSSSLQEGDLILSKVGNSIGYFAKVSSDLGKCNISENNIGIKLSSYSDIEKSFILTYLNSKYANKLVLRRKSGNAQPKINVDDLCRIPIIIFPKLSENIHNLIQLHEAYLNQSILSYKQAEDILNKELGITNIENTKNYSVKSFSESFGESNRLDAEYYQDKYTQLFDIIKNGKQLKELVTITKSIEPGSDEYKDEGIPFLRVSNLTKFGLTDSNVFLDRKKYENLLKPRKDTILFSKDGSIGIAYKAESDLDCITSGALLHLNVKKTTILPDYLTLVLNSKIVQLQAERDSGGSIINHWRLPEIERVIIPMLDYDIQNQISQKVQESFKLRKDSKNLINVAIRAVEIAIEKNEKYASQWLIENTNEIYHKDKY